MFVNASNRRDFLYCLGVALILTVVWGICQNGQWIPAGGDGAFYLTIGRNLASGEGFTFNGAPVTLIPPGWPFFLAGVMSFTVSFVQINLLLLVLCLAAACMWYFMLRRFTSPGRALLITLIVGILFEWHRFTFIYYSEALFYFLFASTMLAAFQIAEGKVSIWRIAVVVLLSIMMIAVRWAGLLLLLPIIGVLTAGQIKPKLNRPYIAAILVAAFGLIAFTGMRYGLAEYAYRRNLQLDRSVENGNNLPTGHDLEKSKHIRRPNQKTDSSVKTKTSLKSASNTQRNRQWLMQSLANSVRRLVAAGDWPVMFFWPPGLVVKSLQFGSIAVGILGWTLIALYAVKLFSSNKNQIAIWIGVFLYCGIVCFLWHRAVPRYVAPAGPLLVLGIWLGAEVVIKFVNRKAVRRMIRLLLITLLAGAVACNLSILAFNAWVAHSPKFHELCLAGEYDEILQISEYLHRHSVKDQPVGICIQYRDLIRSRSGIGSWASRAIVFLTGRHVRNAPRTVVENPSEDALLNWANSEGLKFILARPSKLVSRIWHLRLPLGNDIGDRSYSFYVLYEVKSGRLIEIDLPEVSRGLGRIPGLLQ